MSMKQYYDLHAHLDSPDALKIMERLGWSGVCLAHDFQNRGILKDFKTKVDELRKEAKLGLYVGAEVSGSDIAKKARDALEYADIILVHGGLDSAETKNEANRAAAESYEVDVLCHPERFPTPDLIDQRSAGIDDVTAKLMSEHHIALELNFNNLLNSYGVRRSQILGRMRQNITLARKYKASVIIAGGAHSIHGLRAPRELIALGVMLGLPEEEAKAAVSKNPQSIIRKAEDRRNPNVILGGLEVVREDGKAGSRGKKRMFGWY